MGLPRFAVVDVETSGLSTRRHHLLQIGLVTVEADGTVVDSWSTLIRLRRPWSRIGPRKVHGITRRSLRRAPTAAEALTELAARLSGAVFTAHNVEFDAAFLERAAGRHGVALDLGPRLCTLQLSRRLDPDRQLTHDLAAVCARYGVTIERHHDARCDAAATAAVLPYLLRDHQVAADEHLVALYWRPRRAAGTAARPLFHLALGDEWRAAAGGGEAYRRSTIGRSLDEEGFIHCSFADQVQATADRFYGDRDDVVLLTIDQAKLRADVRVEAVPGGERFPHLYGPLPLDAVTHVATVPVGTDGRLDVDALVGASHTAARQGPASTAKVASGPTDDDGRARSDGTVLGYQHHRRPLEVSAMADLDARKREKLPAKEFGLSEKARTKAAKKESGNYPMPDKKHARNAKSRAAQQEAAGNLTKKEHERIDRKADKILDD